MSGLRNRTILVLSVAAAFTLVACGADGDAPSAGAATSPATSPDTPADTRSKATTAATGTAPALRAVRTVERRLRGARSFELELEGGRRPGWEINVSDSSRRAWKYRTDRSGKRVQTRKRDKWDNDAKDSRKVKVTLARALKIATRRSSLRFDQIELERTRSGRLVWEAEFKGSGDRETEVTVDARTGKVLRVKHDD